MSSRNISYISTYSNLVADVFPILLGCSIRQTTNLIHFFFLMSGTVTLRP